ncbi:hypothetical protein HYW35_02790 [Candidatus Saccharibacteria bacterium]|nr:hypothetical protein [Candidatus Saccharibacteria bacterium]
MHIFFSGIGGTGIGPLALIAKQAGYEVSGSDSQDSQYLKYLTHALKLDAPQSDYRLLHSGFSAGQASQGSIHVGQSAEKLAEVHARRPIDWFVYSSALPKTDPNHPELAYVIENGIRASKRDEFLNEILSEKNLKLIAIAGTHGKTTTTAMAIWLFKQLGVPVTYSVGTKISFGKMGQYEPGSQYFIYEADEYDRNFLAFHPYMSLITGLDWDHPDIYPTREEYYKAFKDFISQSAWTVLWQEDADKLALAPAKNRMVLNDKDQDIDKFKLAGLVNRQNAWLTAKAMFEVVDKPLEQLIEILNKFPGLYRRFEELAPNIYSDYAHTPGKIRGALQLAQEVAGDNVVVIYEGLHNLRQHFIKDQLKNLFDDVKQLYIVPTYLAREDPKLPTLSPDDIKDLLSKKAQTKASAAALDEDLKQKIIQHTAQGDTVLCLSAGGAGGLDEWLRRQFASTSILT